VLERWNFVKVPDLTNSPEARPSQEKHNRLLFGAMIGGDAMQVFCRFRPSMTEDMTEDCDQKVPVTVCFRSLGTAGSDAVFTSIYSPVVQYSRCARSHL